MRKVFISTVIMSGLDVAHPVAYRSRDFELGDKSFSAPICYLLDANIETGDEVMIVTGLTQTKQILDNYAIIRKEMDSILAAHGAKAEFITVDEPDADTERDKQDALTFSEFLKEISNVIQDGDRIYADMTYGIRCYTLALFIAMNYAMKSCRDVTVERMIYSQFYKGQNDAPSSSDIIDITTLANINAVISDAKPGQKQEMDKFLSFLIG